jgi:hypothetical protein
MAYRAEKSRSNPTCFLFMVDQSGSMKDTFGAESDKTKAQSVADAINRLLRELVLKCTFGNDVRDYLYIGVIGYGEEIGLGFTGELAGQDILQPVSAIRNHPLRIEQRRKKVDDGAGGLVEETTKFQVWVEPIARGKTLMCGAFQAAQEVVRDFVGRHPDCFPPIIINITDGEATDGDPEPLATELRSIASTDGGVLLFNLHISKLNEHPILFPVSDADLPDKYARMLFRMSSSIPREILDEATIQEEAAPVEGSRGFAFNADFASVVAFLRFGTGIDKKNRNT